MLERTKICSIILAAGSGKRFGAKKQFLKLAGKHILLWSVERFLPFSGKLLVVLPPGETGETGRLKDIIKKYPRTDIVEGGAERYDSVRNALRHVPAVFDIVCIHDGVRPFVSRDDVSRCIFAAKRYGAAICACPSTDTVKTGHTGAGTGVNKGSRGVFFVRETLNRDNVFLVQTPQAFRRNLLLTAYNGNIPPGTTDDARVVEIMGHRVAIVPTSPSNIKITTRTDFAIAQALAKKF
ncbi:MAG: 2-C-methyl-D-erythritol 4-phosphate cytidylyltransferase [Elusimicrobia bacterium]|nr:2-C-methyl-D-erythritol 4-phosphate cytidylyltransferase [Elusimicrobiota bacterium]